MKKIFAILIFLFFGAIAANAGLPPVSYPIATTLGGTGASTLPNARGNLGLGYSYNCYFYGDSNTATLGAPQMQQGFPAVLATDAGCNPVINGVSGTFAEEISYQLISNYIIPTNTANIIPSPLIVYSAGTNNGYYCDPTGSTPQCLTNYTEALSAGEYWAELPLSSKILGSGGTTSGSWSNDSNVVLKNTSGGAEKSTTNGNTITFTVSNSGPKIGITRISKDGNGGTATISIDGTLQTDLCTGTTTFQFYGCGGNELNNSATNTNAPQREEFSVTPGVSHTVVVTVTSATSSSNIVSILDVDTTPASTTTPTGPLFMQTGVEYSYNNGTTPSGLTAMDTASSTQAAAAIADGLNVVFVNVRTPITFAGGIVSPAVNNSTDMNGTSDTYCIGSGANGLHMNTCGYAHLAQTIEATAMGNGKGFAYPLQGNHPSFNATGYSSMQSVWNTNTNQIFSTTAGGSGIQNFGTPADGYLSFLGFQYDSTNSLYSTAIDFGPSTELAFNTCNTPSLPTSNYSLNPNPQLLQGPTPASCTQRATLSSSGNLTVKGTIIAYNNVQGAQFIASGNSPTIAAGAGAGTSPTVSISGVNIAGVVNITTGTSPSASAVLATITFNGTLSSAPKVCQLTALNAASATAATAVYETAPSTTSWVINVNSTALSASTAYSWGYTCI